MNNADQKTARRIVKLDAVPSSSVCARDFGRVDYCDAYTAFNVPERNLEETAARVFALPAWANWLMKIRNAVVGLFGLKAAKNAEATAQNPDGSPKPWFAQAERTENELVTGEDNRHLRFRLSLLREQSTASVTLITLVSFHNVGGRIYFFLIKPFHGLIVRALLKKLY